MTVACANRRQHQDRSVQHHHHTVEEVKRCFTQGLPSLEEVAQGAPPPPPPVPVQEAFAPTEQAEFEWDEARPADEAPDRLIDGIYTVEKTDGHRTFRLRTQAEDDDFAPGCQIVSYLSGPNNGADYTSCGLVNKFGRLVMWKKFRDGESATLRDDLQALLSNPDAALVEGHCYLCHRRLTTPESIRRGVGDYCASKA